MLVNGMKREAFLSQYRNAFNHGKVGWIGHELELVLIRRTDGEFGFEYVPEAHRVLLKLWNDHSGIAHAFDKEFWNGQVEVKTDPQPTPMLLVEQLLERVGLAQRATQSFGWELIPLEYLLDDGPKIPVVVSPLEPRYEVYREAHPERAPAMYRVASGQFHFGMRSLPHAFEVFCRFISALPSLAREGWACTERIQRFEDVICPGWFPPELRTEEELWQYALRRDFVECPPQDYGAVRIHPKWGTVEFRLPGPSVDQRVIQFRAEKLLKIAGF